MISRNDTILIAGDSWGCGEWADPLKPDGIQGVVHGGLGHFLLEYGCKVINCSAGGSSNYRAIERIELEIKNTKPDYIFWFQTDPMRDLRPYDTKTFPKSIKDMVELGEQLLNDTYNSLNNLGVNIHCMGGVAKLTDSIRGYSNLHPLIPSIIEMFGGEQPKIWISEWIGVDHLTFDNNLLTELEKVPPINLPKKWFYPDWFHPNRHAHHEIFKYILKHHK